MTTFGDSADKFIAGLQQNGQFTVSGPFDDAAGGPDVTFGTLVGGSSTGTFYPVGTSSGDRKFTFDFYMLSYRPNVTVRGRVGYEATFVVNGTVAIGTA